MNNNPVPIKGLTTIIALMTMIGPFTIDTYLPSFPAIEAEFSISRSLLSQSLGVYLAAFAVATLFLGPLSDRLGRRPVILLSLLVYIAASTGCALSNDYHTFLFFRVIQGIAAAGGLVAGRAIIRDVYSPQDAHHALSRIMMLFAIAPAIAPIIGGGLHELFGWHSVFYFLGVFAGFIFFLFLFHIPETLEDTHRQSFHPVNVARVYGRTIKHRRFQSLIFILALYFAGLFLYIAGAPTVIYDFLQLDHNDFSYLFVPTIAGVILGSWTSSKLARRWPIEHTVKLALGLMSLGAVLNGLQSLLLAPAIFTTIVPLVFYTCGIGIAMPALTVMALDCFPKNRGAASALQGFVQMLANAFVASLAVPFLQFQPVHMAAGQLLFLGCALLLWWRLPPAEKE